MYPILRKKVRNYALDVLSLISSPKPGIHILNGHFLSLDNSASPEIFKILIQNLLNHNVSLIDFDKAVHKISSREFPKDKCMVAFSFDDGFEECYTKIAPVLDGFKIKAAFFINPAFIECNETYRKKFLQEIVFTDSDKNPMNWEQIKGLNNNGHIIGSHTMDHYRLQLYDKNFEYQIQESKNVIGDRLGKECDYLAYPYGRLIHFSKEALAIAEKNFRFIFSQDDYRNYFSFNGRVINRRHFECDWPHRHVLYFLKNKKSLV